MKFGTYSLLLSLAAVNAAFLVGLLFSRSGRHRGSRWLAALTAGIALRLMPYILGFAGAYDLHHWLTFAPFDVTLALGPLLWVYVVVLSTDAVPPRVALHFVPVAVQLAYQVVAFALPVRVKWEWYGGAHLAVIEPVGTLLVLLSLAAYGRAAYQRYEVWQAWLDANLSNREESRLGWLRAVLAGFAVTGSIGVALAVVHWTITPLDYFARMPVIVALAALSYLVALLGYRFGGLAIPITTAVGDDAVEASGIDANHIDEATPTLPPIGGSDANTPATLPAGTERGAVGKDYAADAAAWRARVIDAGWHRDPGLTLARLAALLHTSTRSLSRTLNEGLGESFNDFVNRIRVEEAAAILARPGSQDVLRVAFDVGFASKASFNRAFLRHLGDTPTGVRARMQSGTSQLPPI
jgi:AraC-like DNA-binding protein